MENVSPQEFLSKIYKEKKYLDTYGGSVIAMVIIILLVFWVCAWYHIRTHMDYLKKNWNDYKCHPGIMPFAGQIKLTPGMTPMDFTSSNFSYCLNQVLEDVVKRFMEPILTMNDKIKDIFAAVIEAFKVVEKVFKKIKNIFESIINYILSKTVSIIIPFQKTLILIKDSFQKTGAVMGTLMYLIMGFDYFFSSYMKTFITSMAISLAVAASAIIGLWIMPWTWPLAIAGTIAWIVTLIATVLVHGFLQKIVKMTSVSFPPKPGRPAPPIWNPFCFHPDTPVKMNDCSTKKMKNINVGDILFNGSMVETTMNILGKSDNPFYEIYSKDLKEYILVTGTHKIYDKKTKKFIYVKDFEEAKKTILWGKRMRCLVTENHTIPIGEHIFWDWED